MANHNREDRTIRKSIITAAVVVVLGVVAAPAGANHIPGATYTGTHSGGGPVTFTVYWDADQGKWALDFDARPPGIPTYWYNTESGWSTTDSISFRRAPISTATEPHTFRQEGVENSLITIGKGVLDGTFTGPQSAEGTFSSWQSGNFPMPPTDPTVWEAWSVNSGTLTWSATTTATPPPPLTASPKPAVPTRKSATVIVPGLDTYVSALDTTTTLGCAGVEVFRVYCEHLAQRGQRVLTAPSKGSAWGRTYGYDRWKLDVHDAFVDTNAQRLDRFVREQIASHNLYRRPLLAGHSMGGLIARVAIARYGTPARGLVTIGSPHMGSEWANGIAWTPPSLRDRISWFRNPGASIWDLTILTRVKDNLGLPKLTVPARAMAGNWLSLTSDGMVNLASACGVGARIGGDLRCSKVVRDIHGRREIFGLDPTWSGVPNLQDDPAIASALADIAQQAGALSPRSAARAAARPVAKKPPGLTLELRAEGSLRRRGRTLVSIPKAPLFARQPFGVRCGRQQATALWLVRGLYYLPNGAARCARGRLTGAARTVISNAATPGVRGNVTSLPGSRLKVTVTARRLRGASVRAGKRSFRGRRRGRTVTIVVPRKALGKRVATVFATVGKRRFSASMVGPPPVAEARK